MRCVMCCVNAPDWRGQYDYYSQLEELIKQTQPEEILVQGGEVLIQKQSIEWLTQVKQDFPDIKISLVTNGNVNQKIYINFLKCYYGT